MDKNKSTKLVGVIAKLTVAANKSVKNEADYQQFLKRPVKPDFPAPVHFMQAERLLRAS